MKCIKSTSYSDFKFGQCIRSDVDFQKMVHNERYNTEFMDQCSDIFNALYQKDIEYIADGPVKTLLDQAIKTDSFKNLKTRCTGNAVVSYINMKNLIKELQLVIHQIKVDQKHTPEKLDKVRQISRVLFQKNTEETEVLEEVISTIDLGHGDRINSDEDIKQCIAVAKRISKDKQFKALLEMAGRMERQADTAIKTSCEYGCDELVGVTFGSDIANVLPEETVHHQLFAMNYVEDKLMINKFKGKQPHSKGPIIVCIDESGSMEGFRYHFSRAILFGLFIVAMHEERPLIVNRFSHEVSTHYIKDTSDIMAILDKFMNGGTDFELALSTSFDQIKSDPEFTKADIIFLTDGECGVSSDVMKRIKSIKDEISLKIISLMIGYNTACLKQFSDEVYNCINEDGAKDFCNSVFNI